MEQDARTDEDLMIAYRDGDSMAFEVLYGRWRGPLYRYFLRQCSHSGLADELFQDVFLRVIGAAVYREHVEPPRAMLDAPAQSKAESADGRTAGDAAGAPGASPESSARRREPAGEKLGTGHGERIQAPAHHTEFRRASSTPGEIIAIYYDSRRNLIAQGIIPGHARMPQPFPNGGFVPDPS